MHRIPIILFALFALSLPAAAQQAPERSQVRKGNRAYHKGEYERAAGRYARALELSPGLFEATYDLGNALYKAERYEEAEKTLRQAAADSLRTDAERAEAFNNLGNALFRQEKYREALESYRQSLRLVPSDMETKYNYAYTKQLLKEDENGGGGDDQNKDQNKDQNQGQDQNQDKNKDQGQDQNKDQNRENPGDRPQGENPSDPEKEDSSGEPQGQRPAESAISPEEQERMLDAIQAQEDRTQERLKEQQGTVIRGRKNW